MGSTISDHRGPWRFEELPDLPDDSRRYEVVDGSLVVSPPPTQAHQLVVAELVRQLLPQCTDRWRVVSDWPLPLGTDGRVPDLAVIDAGVPLGSGATPYPLGPEHVGLVVEVVSPSSRKTDRFAKPGEYAEAGIPLLWRVETEPDLLLVAHRLAGAAYEQVVALDRAGAAPVPWGVAHVDLTQVPRPG